VIAVTSKILIVVGLVLLIVGAIVFSFQLNQILLDISEYRVPILIVSGSVLVIAGIVIYKARRGD
jgi:hypothetical protein